MTDATKELQELNEIVDETIEKEFGGQKITDCPYAFIESIFEKVEDGISSTIHYSLDDPGHMHPSDWKTLAAILFSLYRKNKELEKRVEELENITCIFN